MALKASAAARTSAFSSTRSLALPPVAPCPSRTRRTAAAREVIVRADFEGNPVRQAIAGVVSTIYKVTAAGAPADGSPLWVSVKKLDLAGVRNAASKGGDLNERDGNGDTPLLYIARQGHYKYPPAEIPQALISAGADKDAQDRNGLTALQVSLLAGWQNIAELLIKSGADTSGVPSIKARLTCPDCKRLVARYNL